MVASLARWRVSVAGGSGVLAVPTDKLPRKHARDATICALL